MSDCKKMKASQVPQTHKCYPCRLVLCVLRVCELRGNTSEARGTPFGRPACHFGDALQALIAQLFSWFAVCAEGAGASQASSRA